MTLGDVFLNPRTPLLWAVLVVGLVAGLYVLRRIVRAITDTRLDGRAAEARLTGSIGRIGARTGRLEASLRLAEFRRLQVEECLRRQGIGLPPWPGDQDVYDEDNLTDPGGDDRAPATAAARAVPPVPPLPEFPRHRR